MEPITISFDDRRYFVVAQGDRAADGLGWDEMLGQVVGLTQPMVGVRLYPMLTAEQQREREYRWTNPVESECDDWSSNAIHIPC